MCSTLFGNREKAVISKIASTIGAAAQRCADENSVNPEIWGVYPTCSSRRKWRLEDMLTGNL